MIDLHTHILPGLDDGSRDLAQSVALASELVRQGVTIAACTPHVSGEYPTQTTQILQALTDTRAALASAGVDLALVGGAEVALDRLDGLSDEQIIELTIDATGRYLLVETPYSAWPLDIDLHLQRLAKLGITAILAHPERSAGVQPDSTALERAVDCGALVQLNAGSLTGSFGRSAKTTAMRLMANGTAHLIASDSHNVDRRPPHLVEAVQAIGDKRLAQWLTVDVPSAITRGEDPPDRPSVKRRRASVLSFFRK